MLHALGHLRQGVEHRAALAHPRRRDQHTEQHLHGDGAGPPQRQGRLGAMLRRAHEVGYRFQHRLGADAAHRDPVLAPRAAPLGQPLLDPDDPRDQSQHLFQAVALDGGLRLLDHAGQQVADVSTRRVALQLGEHAAGAGPGLRGRGPRARRRPRSRPYRRGGRHGDRGALGGRGDRRKKRRLLRLAGLRRRLSRQRPRSRRGRRIVRHHRDAAQLHRPNVPHRFAAQDAVRPQRRHRGPGGIGGRDDGNHGADTIVGGTLRWRGGRWRCRLARAGDTNPGRARPAEACGKVLQTRLVGQRPEQLEQLTGRRILRQGDRADAVQVEPLDQPGERGRLARHAVQLEVAGRDRERDRELLEQPEQHPEFRLLSVLRTRVAKQLHTAREACRNRVESRHTAREQSRTRSDPRQRGPVCERRHARAPAAPAGRARPRARLPVAERDQAA